MFLAADCSISNGKEIIVHKYCITHANQKPTTEHKLKCTAEEIFFRKTLFLVVASLSRTQPVLSSGHVCLFILNAGTNFYCFLILMVKNGFQAGLGLSAL